MCGQAGRHIRRLLLTDRDIVAKNRPLRLSQERVKRIQSPKYMASPACTKKAAGLTKPTEYGLVFNKTPVIIMTKQLDW